jgi:hypothetical protein
LVLAAIGGTILAAPIALPVLVTSVGGYLVVAAIGAVVSFTISLVLKSIIKKRKK